MSKYIIVITVTLKQRNLLYCATLLTQVVTISVAPLSQRFGHNPGASFTLFHGAIIPKLPYLYPGSFIRSKMLGDRSNVT
jgi:hypothetical protein